MLSNLLTLQTKDKVCVLSSLIVSILIACQINSKMTKTGRLSPGDPNSYSRPDIAKVTHIHLKLDINFDQQILDGLAILDVEKIDPELWKKFNSGASNNVSGDHLEAFVSDALDKIYLRGRQTAVVFRGIDLTKLETSQSNSASNYREIDFLIVNYTYGYILKLECKRTFDHDKH